MRAELLSFIALGAAMCVACGTAATQRRTDPGEQLRRETRYLPPWRGEEQRIDRGVELSAPGIDNLPDFHGNPKNAGLVLFSGGEYVFVLQPLVEAFVKEYPELKGRVFYETLPPGILLEQIRRRDTISAGNLTLTVHPDVFHASINEVKSMMVDGTLRGPAVPFMTSRLAIMVPLVNPANVMGLGDLGRPGVRLVMPDPATEGSAQYIREALHLAGGDELLSRVYDAKVANGQTVLTVINHRQAPLYVMECRVDATVAWRPQIDFHRNVGHPVASVEIPDAQNRTGVFAAAVMKDAPHPEAAEAWLKFLVSPRARRIFQPFGFRPYRDERGE